MFLKILTFITYTGSLNPIFHFNIKHIHMCIVHKYFNLDYHAHYVQYIIIILIKIQILINFLFLYKIWAM